MNESLVPHVCAIDIAEILAREHCTVSKLERNHSGGLTKCVLEVDIRLLLNEQINHGFAATSHGQHQKGMAAIWRLPSLH